MERAHSARSAPKGGTPSHPKPWDASHADSPVATVRERDRARNPRPRGAPRAGRIAISICASRTPARGAPDQRHRLHELVSLLFRGGPVIDPPVSGDPETNGQRTAANCRVGGAAGPARVFAATGRGGRSTRARRAPLFRTHDPISLCRGASQ